MSIHSINQTATALRINGVKVISEHGDNYKLRQAMKAQLFGSPKDVNAAYRRGDRAMKMVAAKAG